MTLCPGAFSIFHWGLPDTAKGFICTMTASRALSPVLRHSIASPLNGTPDGPRG